MLQALLSNMPGLFLVTGWVLTATLNAASRRMVLNKLRSLAMGLWPSERSVKRINASNPALHDLELWSCKLLKGARILFEIAVDFEEASRTWKEMVRLWVGSLTDLLPEFLLTTGLIMLQARLSQMRMAVPAFKCADA